MNAPQRTEFVPVRETRRLARGDFPRLGGRYAAEEEVGRGATGVVYRARETATSRVVAVKVCALRDEAALGRVRREAAALAGLEHPSIARVVETFEADGLTCVVSEFVEGEDLSEVVARRKSLPSAEALGLFLQLLEALEAVHSKGVVHRDVKPANIRIRAADGRLVLVDFGLVRMEGKSSLTGTGEIVGTPAYMAPEQVDDPRGVDARADLYAAAAVLHFMLEGRPPYEGRTAYDVWSLHRSAPIPRLTRGSPVERLRLGRLVSKGLAKRPSRRWPSARTGAADVRRASSRIAAPVPLDRLLAWVHVGPIRSAENVLTRMSGRRSRASVLTAAAAAATLAASGIALLLWLRSAVPTHSAGGGDEARDLPPRADLAGAAKIVRARLEDGHLVALDASGRQQWSFDPGGPLRGDVYSGAESDLLVVSDITGDGVEEVLFATCHEDPSADPSRLHCFDRTGRMLWRVEAGRREVVRSGDFRETAFEAGKIVLLAAGPAGVKDVVLVSRAHVWSPSQALWLDAAGRKRGEWWNHGTIGAALAVDLNDDGRDELVVGSYNNTYGDSGLAVLDPSPLRGSSPPGEDGRPVFEGIGPGTEAAYVRFPRNEIARSLDKGAQSDWIREEKEGILRVKTGVQECPVFYDLDRGLGVVNAFAADDCRGAHRRLEIAGALDHPYVVHAEDFLPAPLYWTGSGWSSTPAWNRPLAHARDADAEAGLGRRAPSVRGAGS